MSVLHILQQASDSGITGEVTFYLLDGDIKASEVKYRNRFKIGGPTIESAGRQDSYSPQNGVSDGLDKVDVSCEDMLD